MKNSFVIAAILLVAAGSARAEPLAPGRYTMQKTESGIARLDTQTGEISLCIDREGQITCRMAADERAALETEIDRLSERVEALEKAAGEGSGFSPRLPTQEEIDRTMSVMERMMRKFMDIVKDLGAGETEPPAETETL